MADAPALVFLGDEKLGDMGAIAHRPVAHNAPATCATAVDRHEARIGRGMDDARPPGAKRPRPARRLDHGAALRGEVLVQVAPGEVLDEGGDLENVGRARRPQAYFIACGTGTGSPPPHAAERARFLST